MFRKVMDSWGAFGSPFALSLWQKMSVCNTRLGGLEAALSETGWPMSSADWTLDGGVALRLYGIGKAVTVGQ